MKRVIITGASGAIGTALITELINNKVEVLVLCRKESSRNYTIPNDPLVEKRYCSLKDLKDIQNNTGKKYDIFYHFAWDGTAGISRNDMHLQYSNIGYALDAVGAAKRFGCHTFIGAGSQAEYGRVNDKLKADTSTFPESGYGIAKLCAGQMTREYSHQIDMAHIWVRVLSVYGANDGEQSLIMSTINKLKSGITPQLTKGEQMWDYLHSSDAARAFRLIGEKGIDGKTYVLGSGDARPLIEYIEEIREVLAPDTKIAYGAIPYTENQVMFLQADISELQKDTGFIPKAIFKDEIRKMIT